MGNKNNNQEQKNKILIKTDELETKYKQNFNMIQEKQTNTLISNLEKERNEKIKYDMNIIVYSDEPISNGFKAMINKIKRNEWKITYIDGNFTENNSNNLILKFKKEHKEKKFKNVVLIPISSMNYLKEIMKDASKNIFEHFSDLEIDEQPFIIFIDYNNNDFEYKIYDMKKTNNPFEELKNIY